MYPGEEDDDFSGVLEPSVLIRTACMHLPALATWSTHDFRSAVDLHALTAHSTREAVVALFVRAAHTCLECDKVRVFRLHACLREFSFTLWCM